MCISYVKYWPRLSNVTMCQTAERHDDLAVCGDERRVVAAFEEALSVSENVSVDAEDQAISVGLQEGWLVLGLQEGWLLKTSPSNAAAGSYAPYTATCSNGTAGEPGAGGRGGNMLAGPVQHAPVSVSGR